MATTFGYINRNIKSAMGRLDQGVQVHDDSALGGATSKIKAAQSVANMTVSNQRAKNQFRPRVGKGGATSYQLRQYAEVTLGGGSLRKVVKLPEGEDENEWLAVNSALHTQIKLDAANRIQSGRLLQPD